MAFPEAIADGDHTDWRGQMLNRLTSVYLFAIVVTLLVATTYPTQLDNGLVAKPTISPESSLAQGETVDAETLTNSAGPPQEVLDGSRVAAASGAPAANAEEPARAETTDTPSTRAEGSANGRSTLGIIDSDFSLANLGSRNLPERIDNEGRIETKKDILVGDRVIGSIPITVDGTSSLFLRSRDLKAVLADQDAMKSRLDRLPATGLVSFRRLRDLGIDLRYNPTSDNVTVRGL